MAIVPKIARTMRYSGTGNARRTSTSHSADEHQHAGDDQPGDQADDRRAERDGAERHDRGDEPGAAAVDAHLLGERGQAQRVVPGDPADRRRHGVHDAGVAELVVGVEILPEQQLDASDVEHTRDHGDEDGRPDPVCLVQDGRPVGTRERAVDPRLP
jgi:hypothetical protein